MAFLRRPFSTAAGQRIQLSQLSSIIESFSPVVYSFGYGSGVFKQDGNLNGMVDVILVVDDAQEWHSLNLQQNPHHYATLPRLGGASLCSSIQRIPPGVYFHAGITVNDVECKYGVVEASSLLQDLQEWNYLYLAGRLHKPTVTIVDNDEIQEMQQSCNLPAALSAALLLLPSSSTTTSSTFSPTSIQQHSLATIYQTIASLSYTGDLRTTIGAEDPRKVEKLVHSTGQLQRWNDLYREAFRELQTSGIVSVNKENDVVEYNVNDEATRLELQRKLPASLQHVNDPSLLQALLASIVAPAARNQTIKGVVTAGIVKSTTYAFQKLSKGILKGK